MLRIAKIENGLVEGIPAADPRITAFKGIPYAAPPVGKLRWRAPQPAADWEGVRQCFTFAPINMQEVPGKDPNAFYSKEWHVDPEVPMSEDSLYLNVWTPAKSADEKLPVMVWIFGGGYQNGYTAEMEFDGERIARRGVILVSVGYRVNGFGFLSHSLLMEEDPGAPVGNYGLMDQGFAIKWVQRNIHAFGGDGDNITIFGQSAGAGSVLCQMVSPYTKGVFQRAITHSGGGFRKYGQGGGTIGLEAALENGKRFFAYLGVSTLEEARAIDAETLRDKACAFGRMNVWCPTVDGVYLPDDPSDMVARNEYHDISYMIGNTGNEHNGPKKPATVAELEAFARDNLGKYADRFLEVADAHTDEEVKAFCEKENNVFLGRCLNGVLYLRSMIHYDRKPVYSYYFNPTIPGDNAGAFHSSDLWFAFETLAKCWRPFTGKHYDLARMMCNYWTNFARTGNPNGPDADGTPMPEWRNFTKDDQFIIYLDEKGIHQYEDIFSEALELRIAHIFEEVVGK